MSKRMRLILLKNIIASVFVVLAVMLTSAALLKQSNKDISGYNLSKPDGIIVLPDTLREISGITGIDSEHVGCVQDENGVIFIYNLEQKKLINQFSFNIDGDYEGITRVGETLYILRSDGTLYEISNFRNSAFKVITFQSKIPANDNEGLCYDAENNRLLIASKGKIAKGSEHKDKRVIYGFDLKTKRFIDKPIFNFSVEEVQKYVTKHNIPVRTKTVKKKGQVSTEPFVKFMTSAIAIHPESKKLYLLSADDYLFFIFNMKGEIDHIEQLDPSIFNKAEGITFLENNEMLITNEGQNDNATLLRFSYKK